MKGKRDMGQCCFEEWDREKHEMGHCKEKATKQFGINWVCDFHFRYASSLRDIGKGAGGVHARRA